MDDLTSAEREHLDEADTFEVFAFPAEYRAGPQQRDRDLVDGFRPWRRVAIDAADRRRVLETLNAALGAVPDAPPRPRGSHPTPGAEVGVHARRGDTSLSLTFDVHDQSALIFGASVLDRSRTVRLDARSVAAVLDEIGERTDVRLVHGATVAEWLERVDAPLEGEALERAVSALAATITSDPRPANVTRAFAALTRLGPRAAPAVPALVQVLAHPYRQRAACEVLAAIGPAAAAAVPVLRERLRDHVEPDRHPHACAGWREREARLPPLSALAAIGPAALPALPEIARCVHEADASIGTSARSVLAQVLGEDDVEGALARMHERDPAPAVRALAKETLACLRGD